MATIGRGRTLVQEADEEHRRAAAALHGDLFSQTKQLSSGSQARGHYSGFAQYKSTNAAQQEQDSHAAVAASDFATHRCMARQRQRELDLHISRQEQLAAACHHVAMTAVPHLQECLEALQGTEGTE